MGKGLLCYKKIPYSNISQKLETEDIRSFGCSLYWGQHCLLQYPIQCFVMSRCSKRLSQSKNILESWSCEVNQSDRRLDYFSKHHLCSRSPLKHEFTMKSIYYTNKDYKILHSQELASRRQCLKDLESRELRHTLKIQTTSWGINTVAP